MSLNDHCLTLVTGPNYIVHKDLVELVESPIDELLSDAKELYNNMKSFEKQCLGPLTKEVYDFTLSMYHLALLKLSTALDDKLKGSVIEDEFVKFILRYYTQDEKNALRDLDKFSKLDPDVIKPDKLADIIVQGRGEIYKLIKEAVDKEYVDLSRVIKTWETQLKIRNHIARAFQNVYYRRFGNIISAVQILLNQQPGWIKRLFEEYEEALLESAEIRKRFEEEVRRVFESDKIKLEEALRRLEEENYRLQSVLEKITSEISLVEGESKRRDEELQAVKAKYENLIANYKKLLEDYNAKITEIENMKKALFEKEQELQKLRDSQETSTAEKIALENEIMRLRNLIVDYEKRLQEYQILEVRLRELESTLKGEQGGNIVRRGEVEYLYEAVVGRARRLLETDEAIIHDARTGERKQVKKWDSIERKTITLRIGESNLTIKSLIFTKLGGVIPFSRRRDIVIEYAMFTHFTDLDDIEIDTRPIDVSELSPFIKERAEEAENEKHYHVLVIISPTGFTNSLTSLVVGEKSPWISATSRYLTLYLVDVIKGKTHFNRNDPVSVTNSYLAMLELSEEQMNRVINYLQSREARLVAVKNNPTINFLRLSDIKQATGVSDDYVIRRALSILEEKGVGKIKVVNKEPVFVYV